MITQTQTNKTYNHEKKQQPKFKNTLQIAKHSNMVQPITTKIFDPSYN